MQFPLRIILLLLCTACVLSGCASDEEKTLSHFNKGKTYFESNQYREAELELRNALKIDSAYFDAHMLLGETYLKLNNPQKAFNSFARAAEIDPQSKDAHLKVASLLFLGRQMPGEVSIKSLK
ncbi:hypothetical protein D3OALGA1CA_2677 [Olavius algarvensis associated proteobacterium Delta 3]|nr:hypothetical protein D3OALGB2SA_2627 [Olavius algarvensis associated proteobacterium Delta 3]CAB5122663.1 hypothetical protein D3OALGA1CA_2677 [Olavius algarvensis associated proteobacterium Delta 3]